MRCLEGYTGPEDKAGNIRVIAGRAILRIKALEPGQGKQVLTGEIQPDSGNERRSPFLGEGITKGQVTEF